MNKLSGKRVLILQQRNWGKIIGRYLAHKLHEEGALLAALTFKSTTHDLIVNQPNAKYELIVNNDIVMSCPREFLGNNTYSLEEICRELGIDTIWPIVSSLRNHTKSYWEKYYYSFRQNVSDEGIIDYVSAVYKYIKIFFDEFRPDVILSPNFVSLPHIMLKLYSQKRNVPMFAITDVKVQKSYIFSHSYNDDSGLFFEHLEKLDNDQIESPHREEARQYIKEFRENFKAPDYATYLNPRSKSIVQKVRSTLSPWNQVLHWYLGHHEQPIESIGINVDYRPPKILLRDYFAHKSHTRSAERFNYYPLENIKKFIYFPLQFQPEAAIDVLATRFSNQIETGRQIAMSLPGDYTLVVKEHPAMIGLRTPSYLEKVARTPNIKLIDFRIPSERVLRGAEIVIGPGSTTIMEAAMIKKPAIQLGNLGTTKILPNVFRHTDFTTLPAKIKEVLSVKLDDSKYERKLENYVAAAYDTRLKSDYLAAYSGKKLEMREILWQDYKKELERVLS